jgi:GNAT superfamily N-acetyltransferase
MGIPAQRARGKSLRTNAMGQPDNSASKARRIMTNQTSPVTIRPLRPDDHERWLPLWRGYLTFYEAELPEAVTATTWDRFFDESEPVYALVAESGGTLTGMAHYLLHRSTWSVAPACYLNDLFVVPETRGQGVAEALIHAVAADAAARGAPKLYWLTHETNVTARRLYDRVAHRSGFLHYSLSGDA